jgi:hypothetical protein
MEFYIQLTPLNNYSSNCVIKLPMKLLTPNLPLSNCVIKLHTELQNHILSSISYWWPLMNACRIVMAVKSLATTNSPPNQATGEPK